MLKRSEVDIGILDKAQELEKKGSFQESLAAYGEFIKKYPNYENIGVVELRTANIYQRLGQYDRAAFICRKIIKEGAGKKEAYIAQFLLFRLQQVDKLKNKMDLLLGKLAELRKEDRAARQSILYQLGAMNLIALNMDEAKKFFKRSVVVDPKSDLAMKAIFNSAWISKEENKMRESEEEFSRIIKEKPTSLLARDCRYQIADILHKEGRYQEAIDTYVKLADEYKGDPVAALCLFQAAASYMYDLNDDEKARELFGKLTKDYPKSIYAKFVAPGNPIGIFVTYLVPRATRVVMWRAGGLLALSGYSGELARFNIKLEEKAFNQTFADWLKKELPDTVGNIYVDIKGTEIEFLKGKGAGKGRITMGKFNVKGEAEGRLELTKEGSINLIVTKAILEKIPIPPFLINNSLTGISLIIRKNFPIIVERIAMDKGEISGEGYGSKRMLKRLQKSAKELLGIEIDVEDLKSESAREKYYKLIKDKFPESEFSPKTSETLEDLFLDFITRMYFYTSFKMLETVKDTKLDYERSVRTLGRLYVKRGKFRVTLKDADINSALAQYIANEFPWIMDKEFMFDVKGFEFNFTNSGKIEFSTHLGLGRVHFPIRAEEVKDLVVEGRVSLIIDKETKLPQVIFESVTLNGRSFPVEKINTVSARCLKLLQDGRAPLWLDEIEITQGAITLTGSGARDFTDRLFNDPKMFVIFQIRNWDLWAAGIQRLRDIPKSGLGDYWRGKGFGWEKEAAVMGGQTGVSHSQYKK